MTSLSLDIEIAQSIKEHAIKFKNLACEGEFYNNFKDTLEVVKEWNTASANLLIDSETEYFTYRARSYADSAGYMTNIISYIINNTIYFGLIFRDYLITQDQEVNFYEDMPIKYFLVTSTPKLLSMWKYVGYDV
jgi:hypothetical protein